MPVALVPHALRHFPFRGSDAVAAGLLTASQLETRIWRRLFPDVYILSAVEMTHRLWCEAALIYADAWGSVAISGLSAAHLMGVDLLPVAETSPVTITVGRNVRPGIVRAADPRLVVIRTDLDLRDVTDDRLPTTTPVRTAYDLARLSAFREAVIAVDALANRRLITLPELLLYSLGAPRCHGLRNVPPVVRMAEPLAGSPMETVLRLTIVGDGLPRPEAQVEVLTVDGEFIGRVDLAYRKQRVGLEYEGDHHRERATFRRDIQRYNAMREAGWIIIRATADDLISPQNLIRQIRAALSERA